MWVKKKLTLNKVDANVSPQDRSRLRLPCWPKREQLARWSGKGPVAFGRICCSTDIEAFKAHLEAAQLLQSCWIGWSLGLLHSTSNCSYNKL